MSKLFSKFMGFFSTKTLAGIDKAGNRYFTRKEDVDGIMKEKRWVIFKGEEDPTSIPVEWICWLNGQRKTAPTAQEMIELEAMRQRVKQNVLLLKREEEERRASGVHLRQSKSIGKVGSPDLKSFIQQFPGASTEKEMGNQLRRMMLRLEIGLQSQLDLVNHLNQEHGSLLHEKKNAAYQS